MVAETIGHYRVTGSIGRGGMGEVFAAIDTRLNRRVALKVLPPHPLFFQVLTDLSKTEFHSKAFGPLGFASRLNRGLGAGL